MKGATTTSRSLPAAPTQAEVAEEFAARNADVLRYAYEKRTWYHFTAEQGWRANPSFSAVQRQLLTLVRDLQTEPSMTQAEQRRRLRVMRAMEKPGTVNAIADFAKRCAPIEAELADFGTLPGTPVSSTRQGRWSKRWWTLSIRR